MFLQAMRRRFDEMAETDPATPSITVRYEDLVSDLPGQALRLSAWLDVDLDPIGALANTNGLSHHRTSETGDASIGRWRRDLSTEVSDRIEGELGPYFDRFGYAALVKYDDFVTVAHRAQPMRNDETGAAARARWPPVAPRVRPKIAPRA